MTVAGVVLAAGAGRRMGGPKAVRVDSHGERWVDRAVRVLAEGGCSPVLAVLGAAVTEVPGAEVVVADDWERGMSASLRRALDELAHAHPEVTSAVVILVDQPGLSPDAVRRIAAHSHEAGAVIATYDGVRGHPIALGRRTWEPVMATAHGDAGAREWLRANPDSVIDVACDGLGSADDVDSVDQ